MNSLGMTLVWCAMQVTVFAAAASLLYLLMRRLSPSTRSTALTWSLLSVIVLSLMAWSPWPRWIDDGGATKSNTSIAPTSVTTPETNETETTPQIAGGESGSILFLQNLWDEMKRGEVSATAVENTWSWTWQRVIAAMFLCGVGIGMIRFISGLWSVQRYRRRSSPIHDAELNELLDIVRAELSCQRSVELRESPTASSPATIGWRRPLILLPPEWRTWTDVERHAVLAHEVAHIRRFDFPAWVVAQLGVVLHFYHPIVHWLAGRLRLEQELAADAAAAAVTGGNSAYLQTLAGMALRQPERPLSWPARTFLPSHHTFLRRIEMLRHRHPLTARAPMLGRALVAACLLTVAVFAAGLRSPFENSPTQAALPASTNVGESSGLISGESAAAEPGKLSLAYVPRDALIVIAAQPSAALSQPFLAPILKEIQAQNGLSDSFGYSVLDLQQITAACLPNEQGGQIVPSEPAMIFHFIKDADQDAIVKKFLRDPAKAEFAGQTYFKSNGFRSQLLWFPTPRIAVTASNEETIRRFIVAGERGASKATWAPAWTNVESKHAAFMMDLERVRASLNMALQHGPEAALLPVSPLWNKGRFATLGFNVADGLDFEATAVCDSPEGAATVAETLKAALILSRNSLSQIRTQISRQSDAEAAMALQAMDLADEVIDGLKVEVTDHTVTAKGHVDAGAQQYVAMMLPAVRSARVAARRSQSMNNLKQIGLAFHNYADVNGHFPPAVVIGPDGKTPHSWRVAILPYLDQQALYQQYKFDEPWDSEHNKKFAEMVIPAYQCPEDDAHSANTSYFALVGKGTVFDNPKGTPFREITDGTSNTLMIVETKKAVPWSKPEDIPVDLEKELPKFGGWYDGGFIASICDGSVRFLSSSLDVQTLKAIITKNGGEVVPQF